MHTLIAGAALAEAYHSAQRAGGDACGLLMGRSEAHRREVFTDSQADGRSTVTTARMVSSCRVLGPVGAFYDAAGALRGLDDHGLDGSDAATGLELLGWFVVRRCAPALPSARDRAVHAALQARFGARDLAFAVFAHAPADPAYALEQALFRGEPLQRDAAGLRVVSLGQPGAQPPQPPPPVPAPAAPADSLPGVEQAEAVFGAAVEELDAELRALQAVEERAALLRLRKAALGGGLG